MPTQQLPDATILEATKYVSQYGGFRPAAAATGIPDATLRGRCSAALKRGLVKTPIPESPQPAPTPEPTDHVLIRRLQNRCDDALARAKRAEERAIAAEDERDSLVRLKSATIDPIVWLSAPAVQKRTRLTPMLFSSDFQLGEVIKAEEIDGLNAYDMHVFSERYKKLIESTIDIADHHTGASDYPGIFYLRGGDAISGGIHDELRETDDLSAVPAIRYLVQHERDGIKQLRSRFGRVRVVSICGNHGRTTIKPRHKAYTERNWETLATWWLSTFFDDDPLVEFVTPTSGDAFFDVEGSKVLLAHGDRMGSRGGAGFVGPAATIARGHQKLYMTWAASGLAPDLILTGHLHTSLKLQRGYANGSLAGYGDFARDIQALPDAAKQWLLFMSAKRGVSHGFEVQVSDRPRRSVYDMQEPM